MWKNGLLSKRIVFSMVEYISLSGYEQAITMQMKIISLEKKSLTLNFEMIIDGSIHSTYTVFSICIQYI